MTSGTIRLSLRGHLWRCHPEGRRELEVRWRERATVLDYAREQGVPEEQVMLFLVNGKTRPRSHQPLPGDCLELLPVIDGG